jgi:hypothetical protein
MDDVGVHLQQQAVECVHVLTLPGAEADVVQPHTALDEAVAGLHEPGVAPLDPQRGAAADAVIHAVGVDQRLQAQGRQQPPVEGAGPGEVGDAQHHVSDAVDLHGTRVRFC